MITDQPIDLNQWLAQQPAPGCGASAFFVGRVRNHHQGKKVTRLFYECYVPMAEKQITAIAETVKQKTGVQEIRVIHRVGWLEIGEAAVVISVSSAHRQEAFAACREVIDRIKQDVPIWKKEIYQDLSHDWVACTHHNGKALHN